MSESIVCTGHPRDMGFAQGRALRAVIEAAVARAGLSTHRSRWPSLRPLVSGPLRGSGAGRALFRHFAHQAERLEGLAQAASLPLDSLLELQLRRGESGAEAAWLVRESRPVVGFRSLDVTLPWLVPAMAGLNEAGLAVLAQASDAAMDANSLRRVGDAPPFLLVQDCLARFEHLAGAVDWCRKRPVEGEQTLLLGDASGARARVEFRGSERRVEAGLGAPWPDAARTGQAGEIAGALGGALPERSAVFVRLDPVGRRVSLESGVGPGSGLGADGAPRARAGVFGFESLPLSGAHAE